MSVPNLLSFAPDGGAPSGSYLRCAFGDWLDFGENDAFTVEAWIKVLLHTSHVEGQIAGSFNGVSAGWFFSLDDTNGLVARVYNYLTGSAYSASGLEEIDDDGLWHHVAMTYDDAGDQKIYLFVGGTEVTYATQTALPSFYLQSYNQMTIGNSLNNNKAFNGDIGWLRISAYVRYTTSFTPPAMCTLPAIDGNTKNQWIGEEAEGTVTLVEDQQPSGGTDLDASDVIWGKACIAEGTFLSNVALGEL